MYTVRVVAMLGIDNEIKEIRRRIAWAKSGSVEEHELFEKLSELEAQKKFEQEPKQNTNQISLF